MAYRGFVSAAFLLVILGLIAIGGGSYFAAQHRAANDTVEVSDAIPDPEVVKDSAPAELSHTSTTTSSMQTNDSVSVSQSTTTVSNVEEAPGFTWTGSSAVLVSDLAHVSPQLVVEGEDNSDVVKKITQDVLELLVSQTSTLVEYSPGDVVLLSAIGHRYVAFRVPQPKDAPTAIQILDSSNDSITGYINADLLFRAKDVAVYVDDQNIYTYKPDQPAPVPLPGAKLSGNETYDHCGGCMGAYRDAQFTYTDSGLTIETYDWTQGTRDAYGYVVTPKKVRELQFPLP